MSYKMLLVLLRTGVKKNGDPWYNANLLYENDEGASGLIEAWLTPDLGSKLVRMGLVSKVEVIVTFGLNRWFKPDVVNIEPAENVVFDLGKEGDAV